MPTETMPEVKPFVNATNSLENLSIADTAQILCENWGFSVFPLATREKMPAPFIPSWKGYQTEPASFEMVSDWWEHHPFCNIAIITGKVSNLVVVDADNENAVKWVQENFIRTPVSVKTHRGFHYFYKYPHGQEAWLKAERERHKKLKDGIDIQIDGCYVVGPNSTHPDGDTYTMFEEFPGAWTDDLVPELQFATDIPEITDTDVNIDLSDVPDYFSGLKQGSRHDAILSYVGALIAKGMPYAEVLQKAREEVKNRCEQTAKDPFLDKEIVSIVRSTFRTHERNHPETATTVNGGQDVATDMSGVKIVEIKDDSQDEWPEQILHPGGLLEKIADYTEAAAARTERIFGVGGAVSLIGAVASQRFMSVSGLRTNMYVLLIGRSSSGKDAPRKAVTGLILEGSASLRSLYGGCDVSSDTSILTYLKRDHCHRSLFVIDEIGQFFQSVKNPNSPKCNVIKLLTELYHKSNDGHIKRYASEENDIFIPWLSLSLLGMSVPTEFWPSLNSGETTNGFLGRLLILESKADYKPSKEIEDVCTEIPEELQKGVQKLWDIDAKDRLPKKDNSKSGQEIIIKPKPYVLEFTDEARAYRKTQKEKAEKLQSQAIDNGNDAAATIYGRNNEFAIKLAMIKYLSDNWQKKPKEICYGKITLEQIEWAWLLVDEFTKRTLESMKNEIHENEFQAQQQKVFRVIRQTVLKHRKKGKDRQGATFSELSRGVSGLDSRQLKIVLDKLVSCGRLRLISATVGTQGGRPTLVYVITEEVDA